MSFEIRGFFKASDLDKRIDVWFDTTSKEYRITL